MIRELAVGRYQSRADGRPAALDQCSRCDPFDSEGIDAECPECHGAGFTLLFHPLTPVEERQMMAQIDEFRSKAKDAHDEVCRLRTEIEAYEKHDPPCPDSTEGATLASLKLALEKARALRADLHENVEILLRDVMRLYSQTDYD